MEVIWTQKAIQYLISIRSYIAKDKPEAARQVAARIVEAAESLARHSHLGRAGRKAGTRELPIANTPFILPYRIRGETLTILAVLHGAQRR